MEEEAEEAGAEQDWAARAEEEGFEEMEEREGIDGIDGIEGTEGTEGTKGAEGAEGAEGTEGLALAFSGVAANGLPLLELPLLLTLSIVPSALLAKLSLLLCTLPLPLSVLSKLTPVLIFFMCDRPPIAASSATTLSNPLGRFTCVAWPPCPLAASPKLPLLGETTLSLWASFFFPPPPPSLCCFFCLCVVSSLCNSFSAAFSPLKPGPRVLLRDVLHAPEPGATTFLCEGEAEDEEDIEAGEAGLCGEMLSPPWWLSDSPSFSRARDRGFIGLQCASQRATPGGLAG